jgi:hypothetical protein
MTGKTDEPTPAPAPEPPPAEEDQTKRVSDWEKGKIGPGTKGPQRSLSK